MDSISPIGTARLLAQSLAPRSHSPVAELVQQVGGIQAQEIPAALWSIGTRSDTITVAAIEQARVEAHSIVLTWAMRGTRHFISSDDIGWLLPLLAPRFIRANRGRYDQLGLNESLFEQAIPLMRSFVGKQGPQPRAAIGAMLQCHGIATEGQRLIHLIGRATMEGVLCFGPDINGDETWVALEDWISVKWEQKDAVGRLARRYFGAFAPATDEDFAAWAGISLTEARQGMAAIAGELLEIEHNAETLWYLAARRESLEDAATRSPIVRFLPRYDTYLLGYQSRAWMVAEAYAKKIHPGGGILHATLLINHQAAGTWKMKKSRTGLKISIMPFKPLPADLEPLIHAEAEAMARFRGQDIQEVDIIEIGNT